MVKKTSSAERAAASVPSSMEAMERGVLECRTASVARAITLAEDGGAGAEELLRRLYPKTGHAHVVGITGAPGAGKSTLADALIGRFRAQGKTVAVLAVDPTSYFTGGAILGDRIRMQKHSSDGGVYIRSMATRGEMGGLSRATLDAMDIVDAAGFDVVLAETVGVGQDEVEIANCAHLVLLVLTPEVGDDIQTIKAGIMEIADVFVVNKSDRPGAERLEGRIKATLALDSSGRSQPPVLRTVASLGRGVDELFEAVAGHLAASRSEGEDEARAMRRMEFRLTSLLRARLTEAAMQVFSDDERRAAFQDMRRRTRSPFEVAEAVMKRMGVRSSR
jgi:LAO/AO transport system kinase